MKRLALCAGLCMAFAVAASAQPRVNALQNNYSYILPGTPNYGIAQGSIFVMYGSGMAPGGLLTQGFNPTLNKNLGGVSVKITVGGTVTEAVPYYVSPTQIAAILPSATPVGDGTITVTYNGQTSPPAAIKVVQGAFGILTLSGAGNGTAAVYDANYAYITHTNAANPGQTVTFWGTGQGPDPNDETRLIAAPQNLGNLPFEVYIGGKRATVGYHGRSQFPGLDQINVVIPDGVSGCFVSVYIKTGTYISNFVTIAVATSGRVCSDPESGLSTADVQGLLSRAEINSGWLYLGKFRSYSPALSGGGIVIPASDVTTDSATANFIRYTPFNYSNYGGLSQPSIGGCVVSIYTSQEGFSPPPIRNLDAGNMTLTLPNGTNRPMEKLTPVSYVLSGNNSLPGGAPLFIPDAGGNFQFTASGAEVGAFQQSLTFGAPINWTNRDAIGMTTIARSSGLEVTWIAGTLDGYVLITGVSIDLVADPAIVTALACIERASVGRFTIPADVLASMIPSRAPESPLPIRTGSLTLANYRNPTKFTAPGLDVGIYSFFSSSGLQVNFQ